MSTQITPPDDLAQALVNRYLEQERLDHVPDPLLEEASHGG